MSTARDVLTRTVGACALGSAVSLFAVTRTWAVQVQARPLPLGPAHVSRSGTWFVPWLSALALVGLAGTGALLATRGRWRAVVGMVLLLAGLGVVAGGVYGLAAVDGVRVVWPLLCVPAGALLAAGGVYATARGSALPAMGARYERQVPSGATEPPQATADVERSGPSPSEIAMWDALDRGEDPSQ
jgi:hypothetical protein